jgi:hypothetical protein
MGETLKIDKKLSFIRDSSFKIDYEVLKNQCYDDKTLKNHSNVMSKKTSEMHEKMIVKPPVIVIP